MNFRAGPLILQTQQDDAGVGLSTPKDLLPEVFVVRAFVQLRQMLAPYKELVARLDHLEQAVGAHDEQIVAIVEAIRLLMPAEEEPPREPFGFRRAKKN